MAASLPSGSLHCLLCQMRGWESEVGFRRTKGFSIAQRLPSGKLEEHTLQLQPYTEDRLEHKKHKVVLLPLPSQVIEPTMISGQEGPSVLYREWAVHKERPSPPSLGGCREALCHPGFQPLSVSERTDVKFPGKQESHVRKSLPAPSPPTSLLTHWYFPAQRTHRHTSVLWSSLPHHCPVLAQKNGSSSDYGSKLNRLLLTFLIQAMIKSL